jgi:hypothetical protein
MAVVRDVRQVPPGRDVSAVSVAVKLEVTRAGKPVTADVTLGEAPHE